MAPAPNPGPSTAVATTGLGLSGIAGWLAVAAPQLAGLVLMLQTETDFGSRLCFTLSWGILNFVWVSLLRRPALSGALSLTMVVVLVLLSRLKHDVAQMTVNFVDLMVIDRDSAAFLFTIFPSLRWSVIAAGLVTLPLMHTLWWLDPFRIRRLPAFAGALACLAALTGYSLTWPDEAWRAYYDDGYLSKFSRSGVTAVSDFMNYGFMEKDAVATGRLNIPLLDSCHPAGRRPNIIMIHDESSFDEAGNVKVPAATAATSNPGTERSANSSPRATAARAGTPNITCWRGCPRARSAASPISSRASRRAASSADCRCRCAAAARKRSRCIPPSAPS
jgi:hypothetical protein